MSIRSIVRWIRLRTIERNHVLKLGLKPGWYDTDFRLIHANFELLRQFVEREKPFEVVNWDCACEADLDIHKFCEQRAFVANEIKDLYHWWVHVYPKRDESNPLHKVSLPKAKFIRVGKCSRMEYDDTLEVIESWKSACKASDEFEEKLEKEDTENLIRLIKIRKYLWT